MNTCVSSHLVFDKDDKYMLKEIINIQQMLLRKLDAHTQKIAISTKPISRWFTNLNVKPETKKVVEENRNCRYRNREGLPE